MFIKDVTFTFPKRDYQQHLKSILANDGFGQSIRVSSEKNKYQQGNVYNSIFGRLLVVRIDEYSHFNELDARELTPVQKKILQKYNSFNVIHFKIIRSKSR